MNKNNVILYVEKNNTTQFYFDFFEQSSIVLFYKDNYKSMPYDFNEHTVKLGISKMINSDNDFCITCCNPTTRSTTCEQCATTYCATCMLKQAENVNNIISNKQIHIKCPACNIHGIILNYPIEGYIQK